MFRNKLSAALVVAAAGLGATAFPAHAQEGTQDDFMLFFKMKNLDKDKDGMVSKKEFLAAMEKAYDMKTKAMAARGGMLTEAQMQEFIRLLHYAGG
ncbi:MAG: hypothetical protein QM722_19480 [Piscinibacter sp.]